MYNFNCSPPDYGMILVRRITEASPATSSRLWDGASCTKLNAGRAEGRESALAPTVAAAPSRREREQRDERQRR
jgi:hypothetical protein